MRARFYSPEIRRFVNQDVLLGKVSEGQTLNRFAFVTGQQVSFVDPFGLAKYCGRCAPGDYDCLLYGGNICSSSSYNGPLPFAGIGGYASIHMYSVGADVTISTVTDVRQICTFVTICGRFGPGIYLGAGFNYPLGITRSNIENSLCGPAMGIGGDLAFGSSIGFEGNAGFDEDGITSIGTAKGPARSGVGIGLMIGVDICYTAAVWCSNK